MNVSRTGPYPTRAGFWRILWCACAAAAVLFARFGQTQVLRDPSTAFGPLVYDNDFAHAPGPIGVSEGPKNIPMGEPPGWFFNLGGSLRERYESFSNAVFDFGQAGGVPSESYLMHRLLLTGDFHFGPHIRTFVQLGDELETGRRPGPQPTDVDRGDLAQGFVEIDLPLGVDSNLNLRSGRQEMAFGSSRLVDIREGPNIHQSFDGIRGWVSAGKSRLDAFWTRPVVNKQAWFDDEGDPTQQFFGAYGTTAVGIVPGLSADLYYLQLDRDRAPLDAGVANDRRRTVGTRLFGTAGALDYNFEAIYQSGEFGARKIGAFALFSDTGYTLTQAEARPRLAWKADVVSGGDSRGKGTLATFYPLFPKNNYFNEANIQTPMNYIDFYPYAQIQPRRDLAFMVGTDFLWRESIRDSFYQPPGLPVIAGDANSKRFLGEAFNLQCEWQATPNLDVNAALVHFFVDGFLRSAAGKDINWVGLWGTFNF